MSNLRAALLTGALTVLLGAIAVLMLILAWGWTEMVTWTWAVSPLDGIMLGCLGVIIVAFGVVACLMPPLGIPRLPPPPDPPPEVIEALRRRPME